MSSRLNQITFERRYSSLKEINLNHEIEKKYDYYPKGLVNQFIRRGIVTVYDLKICLEQKYALRSIGPKREQMARDLVVKYEKEALL